MRNDPIQQFTRRGQAEYSSVHPNSPVGFISRLLGLIGLLLLLVLAFAFSMVFLAIATVAIILTLGYLKYRTASLRRRAAQNGFNPEQTSSRNRHAYHTSDDDPREGLIIEGEAMREDPPPNDQQHRQ